MENEEIKDNKMVKTILNVGAKESLIQLNKARKVVERLLKNSKLLDIRKEQPIVPKNATIKEIEELKKAQSFKNLSKMIDVIIEKNIDDFFELVSILMFAKKEEIEEMPLKELMDPIIKLFSNENVQSFLVSLTK